MFMKTDMDEVDIYHENLYLPIAFSFGNKTYVPKFESTKHFSKVSGVYSHDHYNSQYLDKKINFFQFKAMQAVADHTDEKFLDENPMLLEYRQQIPKMIDLVSSNREMYFSKKIKVPNQSICNWYDQFHEFHLQNKIAYIAHQEAEIKINSNSRISSPFLYYGGVFSHALGSLFVSNILGQEHLMNVDKSICLAALFFNDISIPKSKKTLINGSTTGTMFLGLAIIMPKKYLKLLPTNIKSKAFLSGFSYEAKHQYLKSDCHGYYGDKINNDLDPFYNQYI